MLQAKESTGYITIQYLPHREQRVHSLDTRIIQLFVEEQSLCAVRAIRTTQMHCECLIISNEKAECVAIELTVLSECDGPLARLRAKDITL